MVAKKDFGAKSHPNVEDVSNLEVLMCLRSLKSMKHVTEHFNWQYYYWTLTDQGIQYLRQYLQLPETVVPSTLRKPTTRPTSRFGGERSERQEGERDGKRTGPSGEFNPGFRGDRPSRGGRGGMSSGGYRRTGGERSERPQGERPAAPAAQQN
eukprot:gene7424-8685_t